MLMKESSLWALIKARLPEVHWQRIESGLTARGIPDLNGCYNGREAWLELKSPRGKLSAYQVNWIRKRVMARGRVWVIGSTDDGFVLAWRIGSHSLRTLPKLPDPSTAFPSGEDREWSAFLRLLFDE